MLIDHPRGSGNTWETYHADPAVASPTKYVELVQNVYWDIAMIDKNMHCTTHKNVHIGRNDKLGRLQWTAVQESSKKDC